MFSAGQQVAGVGASTPALTEEQIEVLKGIFPGFSNPESKLTPEQRLENLVKKLNEDQNMPIDKKLEQLAKEMGMPPILPDRSNHPAPSLRLIGALREEQWIVDSMNFVKAHFDPKTKIINLKDDHVGEYVDPCGSNLSFVGVAVSGTVAKKFREKQGIGPDMFYINERSLAEDSYCLSSELISKKFRDSIDCSVFPNSGIFRSVVGRLPFTAKTTCQEISDAIDEKLPPDDQSVLKTFGVKPMITLLLLGITLALGAEIVGRRLWHKSVLRPFLRTILDKFRNGKGPGPGGPEGPSGPEGPGGGVDKTPKPDPKPEPKKGPKGGRGSDDYMEKFIRERAAQRAAEQAAKQAAEKAAETAAAKAVAETAATTSFMGGITMFAKSMAYVKYLEAKETFRVSWNDVKQPTSIPVFVMGAATLTAMGAAAAMSGALCLAAL